MCMSVFRFRTTFIIIPLARQDQILVKVDLGQVGTREGQKKLPNQDLGTDQ